MTTFNIGSQNAASIQNIGGDAVIEGGVHASGEWQAFDLGAAITRIQEEAANVSLPPAARATVDQALADASDEAGHAEPDTHRLAESLRVATQTLVNAGALTSASKTLIEALRAAAGLLGPIGHAAIALL